MKQSISLFFVFLMLLFPLQGQSPEGIWIMYDHKGNPYAEVEIKVENDVLGGRILKLLNPRDPSDYTCSKCPGEYQGKPVEGLKFIWDVKKEKNKPSSYTNGKILVFRIGRIFDCDVELVDNNTLKVTGYMGTTLIGRTQYFQRKQQ